VVTRLILLDEDKRKIGQDFKLNAVECGMILNSLLLSEKITNIGGMKYELCKKKKRR